MDAQKPLKRSGLSALIVYASLTGNTEEITQILGNTLKEMNVATKVVECTQASAADFLNYDLCIVGAYTYGREGELPDEIAGFFDDLVNINLKGKVYGAFGSGEEAYGYYCKSADDFDRQFQLTGATRGSDVVKVELDPESKDIDNIVAFAKNLVSSFEDKNRNVQ